VDQDGDLLVLALARFALDGDAVGRHHVLAHHGEFAIDADPTLVHPLVGFAARAQAHVGQALVDAHATGNLLLQRLGSTLDGDFAAGATVGGTVGADAAERTVGGLGLGRLVAARATGVITARTTGVVAARSARIVTAGAAGVVTGTVAETTFTRAVTGTVALGVTLTITRTLIALAIGPVAAIVRAGRARGAGIARITGIAHVALLARGTVFAAALFAPVATRLGTVQVLGTAETAAARALVTGVVAGCCTAGGIASGCPTAGIAARGGITAVGALVAIIAATTVAATFIAVVAVTARAAACARRFARATRRAAGIASRLGLWLFGAAQHRARGGRCRLVGAGPGRFGRSRG